MQRASVWGSVALGLSLLVVGCQDDDTKSWKLGEGDGAGPRGKQATLSADRDSDEQAGKQAPESAGKQAPESAGQQASESAGKQAPESAGKQAPGSADKQVGTLAEAAGEVTLNDSDAQKGAEVTVGDELEVGAESYAEVALSEGGTLRFKDARAVFKHPGEQDGPDWLELLAGKLYAAIDPGTPFQVHTPSAVAGVRGTLFYLEEKPSEAYLCVCDGEVYARQSDGKQQRVVGKDEDLHIRPDKPLGKPKKSPQMAKMVYAVFDEMGVVEPK